MSPIVSYQYPNDFSSEVLTNGGVQSPLVSFQYPDNFSSTVLTNGGIMSPIASYQYYEWPGNDVLNLQSSPQVSYFYLFANSPSIIAQPTNQFIQVGSNATFQVVANGQIPLSYQWFFNGTPLLNDNGNSLALFNVQPENGGNYSVVITDFSGIVTSKVAKLEVYFPSVTPTPKLPTANPTVQVPSENMTARPRIPSGDQFRVFTNHVFMSGVGIDATKMTIVLTHGWLSSCDGWPSDMANALVNRGYGTNANIVAWDWRDNANLPGAIAAKLSASAVQTLSEGETLGAELIYLLGANYNKPIHFIGHSLGTMVNCHAADFIHGDSPNSPSKLQGDAFKYNAQNTHITLFDEAELVTAVNGLYILPDVLLKPTSDGTGSLINNFWAKVIPDHYVWIDNYISAVGLLHAEAANAMLWREVTVNPVQVHGYAYDWYSQTVANKSGSLMGFRWSFECDSIGNLSRPNQDRYFLQSLDLNQSDLTLTDVGPAVAKGLYGGYGVGLNRFVAYPTLKSYQALSTLGAAVEGLYLDGIQYAGNFVYKLTQEFFSTPSGQPVYSGIYDSTPAYYISPPNSTTYQAGNGLQFTIKKDQSQPQLRSFNSPQPRDIGAGTNNGVYVWLPVNVPSNAIGLSFEFELIGAGTNEYITMGITNDIYLSMESRYIVDSTWAASGVMGISDYAGQQVQLFFSLNCDDGSVPSGQLNVRGIQFYTVPPPVLSITITNNQTLLSWPATAIGWKLEFADTLSSSNQWTDVTNSQNVTDFQYIITNNIEGGAKFFRLHK